MTLTVPEDIAQSAAELAKNSGLSPEVLLLKALHAHFSPITAELQAEFEAWERASDEDMARLEAQEDIGWQ